ncbi:MAG: hypothetical protein DHS20C07_11610 [Methyloligella sp.]|nr:MAG: hypothetical protein DHS20C07_11610 [Methyloligella sp.]
MMAENQEQQIEAYSTISTQKASPPTYLTSNSLCQSLLPLAIIISALAIATALVISLNAGALFFKTETSFLMTLSLEMLLLLSCTFAIWKKTIQC